MMPIAWISPSFYEVGKQIALSETLLETRIHNPKPSQTKEGLWRIALIEVRGGVRRLDNFLRGHGVMFDVDDGTTLEQLQEAFAGMYVILHSTFGATEAEPRWRVIVFLDRPVESVDEHDRVWRWLASKIEAVGGRPEYSARSAVQCFAVPARPPSGFYVAHTIRGAFASTDAALAVIPAPELLPEPTSTGRTDSYDRRLERARRYLEKMPGGIQGSGGSTTTFKAAVAMVRGFGLEPADALRLLVEEFNPRCAPAWTERELVHKVRQAYQRARVPFGAITDRGRAA